VYDLVPTDREPPCRRVAGPPKSVRPPAPKPKPKPKPAFSVARKVKPRPLPAPVDPSAARVGDCVSVPSEGHTVQTFGTSVFDYGTITALPGPGRYGTVSTEPTVRFETGGLLGMDRHVRWERVYPGWVEPQGGWKKWRPR